MKKQPTRNPMLVGEIYYAFCVGGIIFVSFSENLIWGMAKEYQDEDGFVLMLFSKEQERPTLEAFFSEVGVKGEIIMLYEHMRVARTPEELSRYFQKEFTHTRYGELYYDTVDGQACLCVEDGYLLSTPSNGIVWAKKGSEGKGQTCKFACMVLFKELEPKLVEWDMVAAVEDPVVLDATGNPTAVPPAANPTRALTAGSPDGDQRINSAPQVPEEESDSEPGQ